MPLTRPTQLPEFCTADDPLDPQRVVEPSVAKKAAGWALREKPPRNWFNWIHRRTWQWLAWLDQQEQLQSAAINTLNNRFSFGEFDLTMVAGQVSDSPLPSGTVHWTKVDLMVTWHIPAIFGTSINNQLQFDIEGGVLPAAIKPPVGSNVVTLFWNGGLILLGQINIPASSGIINTGVMDEPTGGANNELGNSKFKTTAAKGLADSFITYNLI